MKKIISLSAASYFVGAFDVINSCATDWKVGAHFDIFCKVDLKFSINHEKWGLAANNPVVYCLYNEDIF